MCGGTPRAGAGNFYPLTLVTDIGEGASLEQFGPVLPVIRYHDIEDAIAQAYRVEVGLSASVWSPDIERARAVAARLEAGSVYINHHGVIHPTVPFGGVKKSGWGVQFDTEGLKAVTRPQIISLKKITQ